jgi:rod shape-determining protein MreC
MAAEDRLPPGILSITGALLVGGILWCLPDVWAEKLRGVVHDGLSPGQCVVAATIPQAVYPAAGTAGDGDVDSSWQRQVRYWQAEAALLRAELDELQRVPRWPEAAVVPPLVRPVLRSARVIGWERTTGAEGPAAVLRAGRANSIDVNDLVLAPGEAILDQGQSQGLSGDDLVLAGRSVVGRIARTNRWTSTIQPITDPEFRGQAQIVRLQDGEALLGAEGIIAGAESGTCRLLHIGTTEPVAEGDLVFTSLRGVAISPPLFYGTITRAELKPGEPDWSIEVAPHRRGPPPSEVLVLELTQRVADEPPASPNASQGTP